MILSIARSGDDNASGEVFTTPLTSLELSVRPVVFRTEAIYFMCAQPV